VRRGFILVRWRDGAGEARADRIVRRGARCGLTEVHRDVGSRILADPREVTRADRILVLGRLVGELGYVGAEAGNDPELAARVLVANCWGNYVAVLMGRDGIRILPDPSGAGRVLVCGDRDLTIASDVIDPAIIRAAGLRTDVVAEAMSGGLLDPTTMILGSPLRGVECIPPGTLVHLDGTVPDLQVWSPGMLRGAEPRQSLAEAVDSAVAALRGRHPLVQVSGGLDSSIVLASAAAHGSVTGFTVASAAGDVDESSLARDACSRVQAPLVIAVDEALPALTSFMDAPQVAQPFLHGLDDVFDRQMTDTVHRLGCDRILTGQGGDAVFMQPRSLAPTVDRYADLGLRGLLAGIADDARRNGSSIWEPLMTALLHRRSGCRPPDPAPLTPHLLTRDARESARRDHHPWTRERDAGRPGREMQSRLLANATVVHTPRPNSCGVPIVHPLLAQPVLEVVLGLPTWTLASGPHDRGHARREFAARLPRSIAERFFKGQASAYFSRGVVGQLPELRERLLDGRLVEMGILDRNALDAVLTREHLAHSADYRSLLFVASCEAWAAAWSSVV